jgi:hypothetical protein
LKGEFNDIVAGERLTIGGIGRVNGTVREVLALPSPWTCEKNDITFQIKADILVTPGSSDEKRHLEFIDKNPQGGEAFAVCTLPPPSTPITFITNPTQEILDALNALPSGPYKGEVPLKIGTQVLDRSRIDEAGGIFLYVNKYTFTPDFCTAVARVPLMVNLLNSPTKPDGTPVDDQYINNKIDGMNALSKQACVEFWKQQTNKPPPFDTFTGTATTEGLDAIVNFAELEFKKSLFFEAGMGAKVSVINNVINPVDLTHRNGIAKLGDPLSLIVDPNDGNGWAWAHEAGHGLGLDHLEEPGNLMSGTIYGGHTLTPAQRYVFFENALARSSSIRKLDPVKVNVIRDWKIFNTSDVFFYTNSTPASGYNFTDMDQLFIFSEEPYSSYDFKMHFKDILPMNQNANIILRLFFDTDGNPLTGTNGYDRIALINITDTFPFNGIYGMKILNAKDNTLIFNGTTNVTSLINYIESDNSSNNSPISLGYDLSFDISDAALNALNLSSKNPNVLVQVDYPAAQIRSEVNFSFSNSPEVSPLLTAEPYTVTPNDNITVNGSGFSPNSIVNISINDTQLANVTTDSNGNFSEQLEVPDLAQDWYTVTAEDTNMQSDFTIINVAIPTPWTPPIIDFAPDSPVYDIIGANRTFDIITDQNTNVTWYINGTEVFNQTNVTESSYTYTGAIQGIWNVSAEVSNTTNVSAMQTWIWDITPTALGTVIGQISYSNNGTGILDATVNLTNASGVIASTTTNASGGYNFTNVILGSYNVNTSKPMFFSNLTGVVVIAGSTSTVNQILWMKGDLNNNGISADAGDLVLMKRAAIGEIAADFRYDLNNNGILADAGDVVLMKRASVGEIILP